MDPKRDRPPRDFLCSPVPVRIHFVMFQHFCLDWGSFYVLLYTLLDLLTPYINEHRKTRPMDFYIVNPSENLVVAYLVWRRPAFNSWRPFKQALTFLWQVSRAPRHVRKFSDPFCEVCGPVPHGHGQVTLCFGHGLHGHRPLPIT